VPSSGGGGGITVLHTSAPRMLKVYISPVVYNIYCLQYFALVKADFVYMCICFLFVLEMFKFIEFISYLLVSLFV
jgi:hypothetical protein